MPHSAWMPMYWRDYFQDTLEFSTFQHGIYLLLIGAYWARGGPLPSDPQALSKIARTSCDKLARYGNPVLAKFSTKDGLLYHDRIEKELLRSSERIASASASANARWHTNAMLPISTPTEEQESKKGKILNFVVGKNGAGNGHTTIKDPADRLARFQNTLVKAFPDLKEGWLIIGKAMDPKDPDHQSALLACQLKAKQIGKGWPRQWPT